MKGAGAWRRVPSEQMRILLFECTPFLERHHTFFGTLAPHLQYVFALEPRMRSTLVGNYLSVPCPFHERWARNT